MPDRPAKHYDAIVIGSGVAGLSTAWQLGLRGKRVLVLERRGLSSGASRQASGLLGQLRATAGATQLLMDSIEILKRLEHDLDIRIFHQTGSLRVAQTPERAAELQAHAQVGRAAGLEMELIDAPRAKELMPYLRVDDLLEICYTPSDGYLNPPELASAYQQAARRSGVELLEYSPVERVLAKNGSVTGVLAGGQEYGSPVVINAAGPWSHLVAELANQPVPTVGIGHYYFTLLPDAGQPIDPGSPTLRDRQNLIYTRPAEGGLRVGIYEIQPDTYEMESLPADFEMASLQPRRDHPAIVELIEAAMRRFPYIRPDMPMRLTTGIMGFSPDGDPLLGEIPGLTGLYHCAGFCGHGVAQSPAIGLAMARLVLDGVRVYDSEDLRADRFFDLPEYRDRRHVMARCVQIYADYYSKVSPPHGKQ